jgi:hypothetical protein
MEKTSTKILSMLVIGILLPQITFAAWWSPASWFNKDTPTQEQVRIENKESTTNKDTQTPVAKIDPKPAEVKERVVTKVIKVDNPELQTKIDSLTKQNNDLLAQLNSCRMQSSMQASQPIKVSTTAEDERRIKLEGIDKEILQLIDDNLNSFKAVYQINEAGLMLSCEEVAQRMKTYNYGSDTLLGRSFEQNCKMPDTQQINHLLDAYRLADSKMTHKNFVSMSLTDLRELRSYLTDLYIKYR